MTPLTSARSGDSVASAASSHSGGKPHHHYQKRSTAAMMIDECAIPTKGSFARGMAMIDDDIRIKEEQEQQQKKNEANANANNNNTNDDSFGFGCGGPYGFGCGGLRTSGDARDPFGVVGRVRTMIRDKFSSRVDFTEEAEPARRRVKCNFVEHRI